MTSDTRVDEYLARLRKALSGMALADREDIVEEIRVHIRERAGDEAANVEETLAGLGPAEQLAEEYRTGLLVQKARRSASPLLVLRACLRWAKTGVEGTVVFFIAIFGYMMGVGFLLLAVLKPIFPKHTGLWVGPHVFDFSFRMGLSTGYPPHTVHEVLGWWFIPVSLVLGSFSILATTKLIRILMKRFRWRTAFANTMQSHMAAMVG